MTLQEILAQLLNPGGSQQAAPQMGGQPMVTPVGDHALMAQQRLGGGQQLPPQMPQQQAPQQQAMPPQAPQAPQGQPMPQPASQGAPQPQGGGLGGIGGLIQSILGPKQAPQNNATISWLTSQGMDAGSATIIASDKTALRSYVTDRVKGKGANDYDQRAAAAAQNGLDPTSPEGRNFILTGKLGGDGDGKTRTLSEQEVSSLKLTPGNYQMDDKGKITSIGGVREQDPTFGREQTLRQEYENNPNVKGYQIVRDNYERIRQGAQQTTGAGDLAIVFGYMKMLDPTSVVREGEQAAASNAAGVPAAIRNTYNSIMSGEKLSPEARQQMLAAAQQIYSESSNNLGDLNKRYSGIATNYQLDPARIVQMPEQYDQLAPPPSQDGGQMQPGVSVYSPVSPPASAPPPAPSGPSPQRFGYPAGDPTQGVTDWQDWFKKKGR